MSDLSEREPPKVFGRPMSPYSVRGWLINIATLTLTMDRRERDGRFDCIAHGVYTLSETKDTKDDAIEWLESTARRIMRECLEIAGPMVAVESLVLGDPSYQKHYPVRFK